MTLVAFVLSSVVGPAALNILEDAEPVLSDDQVDIPARGHASHGVDEERISARIGGDTASPDEHDQTDAVLRRPDEPDHMVHLLRPVVRSWDDRSSAWSIDVQEKHCGGVIVRIVIET